MIVNRKGIWKNMADHGGEATGEAQYCRLLEGVTMTGTTTVKEHTDMGSM